MLDKVFRFFRTVIHLKPVQIGYQICYRLCPGRGLKKIRKGRSVKFSPVTTKLRFIKWIDKPVSLNGTYTFLNQTIRIDDSSDLLNSSRLWQYNFMYMDYLLQPGLDTGTGLELIRDFSMKFRSVEAAFEPYPISLRCVNWIKFLNSNDNLSGTFRDKEDIVSDLYNQYRFLTKRPEYHLLGNHLLENGISLLFGAFFFHSFSFYTKAKKILLKELEEQILSDGAHFELSPMYHQIILDRILDSVNLLKSNRLFNDQEQLLSVLIDRASLMLGWLKEITFSDGNIPLVNDSAKGIAPDTKSLLEYASALNLMPAEIQLKECGYRMFRNGNYELFVDYGIPGPDYIPGHAHSDIFSFVLYHKGVPVIVDTGVTTYQAGSTRSFERSTRAHNTVMVNGKEQSEMWGSFRVGRRARPVLTSETKSFIEGYHKGFSPFVHTRSFEVTGSKIILCDRLNRHDGSGSAFLHFSPGLNPEIRGSSIHCNDIHFNIDRAESITTELYNASLGFNMAESATKVIIKFKENLTTTIDFPA